MNIYNVIKDFLETVEDQRRKATPFFEFWIGLHSKWRIREEAQRFEIDTDW